MYQFHHHPDNIIFLRTTDGTYMDTVKNFTLDFGAPYEGLPTGMIERQYEPGIKHVLMTSNYAQTGGSLPWLPGDAYLAAYEKVSIAKRVREEAAYAAANPNQP